MKNASAGWENNMILKRTTGFIRFLFLSTAAVVAWLYMPVVHADRAAEGTDSYIVVMHGEGFVDSREEPLDVGKIQSKGRFRISEKGYMKLMLPGGCVLRAYGETRFELTKPQGESACGSVNLLEGRAQFSAPSGEKGKLKVRGMNVRVNGGVVRVYASEKPLVCTIRGDAETNAPITTSKGEAVSGEGNADGRDEIEGGNETSDKGSGEEEYQEQGVKENSGTGEAWTRIPAGSCAAPERALEESTEHEWEEAFVSVPGIIPSISLDLKPVLPARRRKGERDGITGGTDSIAASAGGSMCLDSSGGDSSAGNVQQGPSGIQKPPPKTRLRVRVRVPGR